MRRTLFICIGISLAIQFGQAFADSKEEKKSSSEILASAPDGAWKDFDPENLIVIELLRGKVVVALSHALAQNHTEQIKTLAREGFYDGLSFYRVIDGFVAQGGDLFETRELKNAKKSLAAEFDETTPPNVGISLLKDSDGYADEVGFIGYLPAGRDRAENKVWHLHCTGAMAMARDTAKDTGGTEFYITLQPQRYLDRNLSVFGRVVDGMEHLQALRRVAPAETVDGDLGDLIVSMRVAADLPDEDKPSLQYLRTDSNLFADYTEARRNRPEDFFYFRPNHIDICAADVPVRDAAKISK
ncbi:peptidylprolyl isomerase [Hyphococcus sp. DH-69]|uniref:peptidylprolyl isomerase n=1 Tax=Hyphococcus formosus TaxID=3143534 RepID=UPI00398AA430